MPKSSKRRKRRKPAKPHPDFPLYAHAGGRWAKKVRGKLHYFGPWSDPQSALERWLAVKDDLLAGRTPRVQANGASVADICNHFLTHKRLLVDSGELAPRTFQRYYANCALIVATFGKGRLVDDLAADDFQHLWATMTRQWSPVAVANEIQMTRSVFRYG